MSHFLRITTEGGYLGRWCWSNTGSTGSHGEWGFVCWIDNPALPSAWAGSIGMIRYLTLPLRHD